MTGRIIRYLLVALIVLGGFAVSGRVSLDAVVPALGETNGQVDGQSQDDADPLAAAKKALAAREAQVAQRESAVAAREASLNARAQQLDNEQKTIDASKKAELQVGNDRIKKTLKVYKALRPEEAAKLLDKMDEKTVIEILNALDQRKDVKLIPYLNQPRVLKWTKETLAGN